MKTVHKIYICTHATFLNLKLCFQSNAESQCLAFRAWFPLTLFASRQRNFSHGTCTEWRKEQNRTKKYLPPCSHLKFKYFSFFEIFLQRSQSDFFLESRGHFTRIQKFSQNGRPKALSGLREAEIPQYILKTRITELQTSFRFQQFFAGTLRKWRLIILPGVPKKL